MSLELLILLPAHFCLVNTKPLRAEKIITIQKKKRKRERERETNIIKGGGEEEEEGDRKPFFPTCIQHSPSSHLGHKLIH